MYSSQMVLFAMTTIATLFCSALIVTAQSTSEEKQTTEVEPSKRKTLTLPKPEIPKVEVPGISTEKKKETEEKELDERPTFDFSLPDQFLPQNSPILTAILPRKHHLRNTKTPRICPSSQNYGNRLREIIIDTRKQT